jgi:hypothetical protein
MVSIMSLWLPILLSAVLVFVVSSIIHMVLQYHRNDFKKMPNEDRIMDALRPFDPPMGDYVMPYAGDMKVYGSPEFKDRLEKGPVAIVRILPKGRESMAPALIMWFVYSILVGVIAAYVAGRALAPGAEYLAVFRFTGAVSFTGYSIALIQDSIWLKRNWGATLRSVLDGLVYSLVTAGAFGWLWPS